MKLRLLLIISTLTVFFTSCATHQQLTYLQDIDESGTENFFPLDRPDYRIQYQDILYIRFYTLNAEINEMLNGSNQVSTTQLFNNEAGYYINGYNVNDSGYVTVPIIGDIQVTGMTLDEARKEIQKKAAVYLKDATVIVKLLSFKFSVIGEVNRPGTYRNLNNQLTVLEAISMAGDITDYGDRSRVLVLRPADNGTRTYRIDLKSKDLLSSEAFFLLPNDLVIVEPVDQKILQLNLPTISLMVTAFFSTVSMTLLILNYLK
ncbi:MAG: polysaccharide biosynthesis/export family protein [Bacteroidota bacterium]